MSNCDGGSVGCLAAIALVALLMNTCGLKSDVRRLERKMDTLIEKGNTSEVGPVMPEWVKQDRYKDSLPEDEGWRLK